MMKRDVTNQKAWTAPKLHRLELNAAETGAGAKGDSGVGKRS